MAYKSLGLAALLASAFRSNVPDLAQETRDEAQEAKLAELNERFQLNVDAGRTAFDQLIERVAGIETANGAQQEDIDGVVAELKAMADTFTGPAGDTSDNGLAAEVAPVSPDAPTSPAVDAAIDAAADEGIEVPEPISADELTAATTAE